MALLAGTIKAPTAAMLLLAMVIAAAAAVSPSSDPAYYKPAKSGGHRGGRHHRSRDDSQKSPQAGLMQCVTVCGTEVTTCFLECYKPLTRGDPVALPLCLLNCTNTAMICASSCSTNIV